METFPLVNGVRHSFTSIKAQFNNIDFVGFTDINFDEKLEGGDVRGASPQLIGQTVGDYKATANFTMLLSNADALIASLGDGYGVVRFDINVAFRAAGEPMSYVLIKGARISGKSNAHAQGANGLVVKFDLTPLYILTNGKCLCPDLHP